MADWDSIASIAEQVTEGKLSAEALVRQSLKAIEEAKEYNAIIATTQERALQRAKQIDADVARGKATGRLLGVPCVVKDNYLTFGAPTTAASNILKDFDAPFQAEAIEKIEAEGAIVVAKANLDSFAHGASTENSDFGVTKNPVDPLRVAGGSSGGSAAAVALSLAPFALGSDTGGSIRQPSSFCGVVGLKPTYGLISRYGVVAMASSTDVLGPITRTVEDAALILDVLAGTSQLDSTTISRADTPYTDLSINPKKLTVGLIKEHLGKGVDPGVASSVREAAETLRTTGAVVKEVSIPNIDAALAVYYIVMPAEVSSNLGRYDGIRYTHQTNNAKTLDEVYTKSRGEALNPEVKRRIMIGNYVLSSGYYDAYYKKAQQVRTLLIQEFDEALKDIDVLVGPVAPSPAFKIGQNANDPLQMYLADIMTVSMSLVGIPAISVPISPANGLPVGLQIASKQGNDAKVLAVAKLIEENI